jgi:hypothetical protein
LAKSRRDNPALAEKQGAQGIRRECALHQGAHQQRMMPVAH